MTYVLRKATIDDVEPIQALLSQVHKGIINLPNNHSSTIEKITLSQHSFSTSLSGDEGGLYLFALEEVETGKILGVSAIKAPAMVGKTNSHFFRKSYEDHHLPHYGISYSLSTLSYVEHDTATSELCSLFLDEKARGKGIGSLLSLGRFFYIANFPEKFTDEIIAELRGVISNDGISPFYEGLGKFFFKKSALEAMTMAKNDPSIISKLLPRHPIYLDLLPESTQKALGAVHPDTKNALSLLLLVGFTNMGEYDVFDGGPKVTAQQHDIHPIVNSREVMVHELANYTEEETGKVFPAYVSTTKSATTFKVTRGYVGLVPDHEHSALFIDTKIAKALQIGAKDSIRVWVTHPTNTPFSHDTSEGQRHARAHT